jgi:hypothetical protein
MPRRQAENNERGFEDAEPSVQGGGAHPNRSGEVAYVDNLPHSPREQLDEGLKGDKIANIGKLPHIALDIGLVVVRVYANGRKGLLVESWHESAEEVLIPVQKPPRGLGLGEAFEEGMGILGGQEAIVGELEVDITAAM